MNTFWNPRRVRFAVAAAIAGAVGVLASMGAVGYAARLVGVTETTSPVAAQYPPAKVTICHHTHSQTNPFVTITVSENAVPAHLGHGDTIGACPAVGATGATAAVRAATPSSAKQKPQHFVRQHKAKKAKKAKKAHPAVGHARPSNSTSKPDKSETPAAGQALKGKANAEHGQGKAHAYGHAKEHGSAKTENRGEQAKQAKADHPPGNGNGNGNGGGNGKNH